MIQYFQSFPYYAFDRVEVVCIGFFYTNMAFMTCEWNINTGVIEKSIFTP